MNDNSNGNGRQEPVENIVGTVPLDPDQPITNGNGHHEQPDTDDSAFGWNTIFGPKDPATETVPYLEYEAQRKKAWDLMKQLEERDRLIAEMEERLARMAKLEAALALAHKYRVPPDLAVQIDDLADQRDLYEARAWALANGRLGTTALTLVALVELYYDEQARQWERRQRIIERWGPVEDVTWVTIYTVQIAERIGARITGEGRNRKTSAENRIHNDVELGVSMGLIEKQVLQSRKIGERDAHGRRRTTTKRECQYKMPRDRKLRECYEMIAACEGTGERRGGKREPDPNKPKCPVCDRVLGKRPHAHHD